MSIELHLTDITVKQEDLSHVDGGGGYREVNVQVTVDKSRSLYLQRRIVAHEILGAYLSAVMDCETICEISEAICDGLDTLEG
jgi:hypothetical protein